MFLFKKLFQPGKIGSLELSNRIIMAPMVTHYAADGFVTDQMIAYYAERAKGGAGLLVLEATYPRPTGYPGRVQIGSDTFVPGLKKLTDEVHRLGAKMAIEINPSRGRVDEADPVSASPIPDPHTGKIPRVLDVAEIQEIEEDFGKSVVRSREAGFDAVMIHGASGYLISEFLSPRTNVRKDRYGGDIRGRARLAVEMVQKAKEKGGEDFPVLFRLAASERLPDGIILEDTIAACRMISEAGADAIDVVSGVAETFEWVVPSFYFPLACNVPLSREIKKEIGIPVTVAGRIQNPKLAEEILESGEADFVVLGRALLADPDFPRKAREGRVSDIRLCLGCLRCIQSFMDRIPLICTVNPVLGKEGQVERFTKKTKSPRRFLIIGGGPAGMQAAVTSAEQGQKVLLLEKEEKLGGQVHLAAVPPFKSELFHIIDYLNKQIESQKDRIKVIPSWKGALSAIEAWKPEAVILAVGSTPSIPEIPGIWEAIQSKYAVTSQDILGGKVKLQQEKVLIIGGGFVGCEIADYLTDLGHEVSIIEILPEVAMDSFSLIRKILPERLKDKKVQLFTGVKEERIKKTGVEFIDPSGRNVHLATDLIIIASGSHSNKDPFPQLRNSGVPVYEIGDCKEPRKILEAIQDGYELAMNLSLGNP